MARAWYVEDVVDEEQHLDGGNTIMTTRTVIRRDIHDPGAHAPRALVAAPRSRVIYYVGATASWLVALAGIILIGLGVLDDNTDHLPAGFGWGLLGFALVGGVMASSTHPEVCTCPEHASMFGCPPR